MTKNTSSNGLLQFNTEKAKNVNLIYPGVSGYLKRDVKTTSGKVIKRKNNENTPIIIQPLNLHDEGKVDHNGDKIPLRFKITEFTPKKSDNDLPESKNNIISGESHIIELSQNKWHRFLLFSDEQYVPEQEDLFPNDNSPSMSEVNQGRIPNCFFIAAIQSILNQKDGAQFIKNMMKRNDDGTATVRLFNPDTGKPEYVRVPISVLADEHGNKSRHKALWLHVLENAYAAMGVKQNERKSIQVDNSIRSVFSGGGHSDYAFKVFTGLNAEIEKTPNQLRKDNISLPLWHPKKFEIYRTFDDIMEKVNKIEMLSVKKEDKHEADIQIVLDELLKINDQKEKRAMLLFHHIPNFIEQITQFYNQNRSEFQNILKQESFTTLEKVLVLLKECEQKPDVKKQIDYLNKEVLSDIKVELLNNIKEDGQTKEFYTNFDKISNELLNYNLESKDDFVEIIKNIDLSSQEKILALLNKCKQTVEVKKLIESVKPDVLSDVQEQLKKLIKEDESSKYFYTNFDKFSNELLDDYLEYKSDFIDLLENNALSSQEKMYKCLILFTSAENNEVILCRNHLAEQVATEVKKLIEDNVLSQSDLSINDSANNLIQNFNKYSLELASSYLSDKKGFLNILNDSNKTPEDKTYRILQRCTNSKEIEKQKETTIQACASNTVKSLLLQTFKLSEHKSVKDFLNDFEDYSFELSRFYLSNKKQFISIIESSKTDSEKIFALLSDCDQTEEIQHQNNQLMENTRSEVMSLLKSGLDKDDTIVQHFLNNIGIYDKPICTLYLQDKTVLDDILSNNNLSSIEKILTIMQSCNNDKNCVEYQKELYIKYAEVILKKLDMLDACEKEIDKDFIKVYGELIGKKLFKERGQFGILENKLNKITERFYTSAEILSQKILNIIDIKDFFNGKIALLKKLDQSLLNNFYKNHFPHGIFNNDTQIKLDLKLGEDSKIKVQINEKNVSEGQFKSLFNFYNSNTKEYDGIVNDTVLSDEEKIKSLIVLASNKGCDEAVKVLDSLRSYYFTPDKQNPMLVRGQTKSFSGSYTQEELNIYDLINKSLKNQQLIVAGTSFEGKIPGLRSPHGYTVLGTEQTEELNGTKAYWIRLRNPWGFMGVEYSINEKNERVMKENEDAADFFIELTDFNNAFQNLFITDPCDSAFNISKFSNHIEKALESKLKLESSVKELIQVDERYHKIFDELIELELAELNLIPKEVREQINTLFKDDLKNSDEIKKLIDRELFHHFSGNEQEIKEHVFNLLHYQHAIDTNSMVEEIKEKFIESVKSYPLYPSLWNDLLIQRQSLNMLIDLRVKHYESSLIEEFDKHLKSANDNLNSYNTNQDQKNMQNAIENLMSLNKTIEKIANENKLIDHFKKEVQKFDLLKLSEQRDELVREIKKLEIELSEFPLIKKIEEQVNSLEQEHKLSTSDVLQIKSIVSNLQENGEITKKDALVLEQLGVKLSLNEDPEVKNLGENLSLLSHIVTFIADIATAVYSGFKGFFNALRELPETLTDLDITDFTDIQSSAPGYNKI